MENIFQSVRVFVVGTNGKLCDKFDQNFDLNCEYDPQGMRLKLFKGRKTYIFMSQSIAENLLIYFQMKPRKIHVFNI